MIGRAFRWIVALSAAPLISGCSGDYWLGGAGGASGTSGAAGMGGTTALTPSEVLDQDVVLTGDESYEPMGSPCVVVGNGHSIRSIQPWHGHVWLHDCRLVGLGSEETASIDLAMNESAWTTVENCTFDASGRVRVANYADSTTQFSHNVILSNALLAEPPLRDDAPPIFLAEGNDGSAPKTFRGNKILKGFISFGRTQHWLIGGDDEADSNVVVGRRAGIVLWGNDLVVRGNYVHDIFVTSPGSPLGNQESALAVTYETSDIVVEHNVLRKGHWVVRGMAGEFRYNAVLDPGNSGWLQQPFEGTKIHHNLFLTYASPGEEQGLPPGNSVIESGLSLVNFRSGGIEVFNNTFDGGGPLRAFQGPAVSVEDASFIDSLRNNVFTRFPFEITDDSQAAVRAPYGTGLDSAPALLGYADYNLFDAIGDATPRNYGLSVMGLDERVDAGFALNDAHRAGPLDEQVDPQFQREPPLELPYNEADVVTGQMSVRQVLALLRELYTPASGSPLVDAGDPADGPGADIGAIGVGAPSADDRFGGVRP